MSLGLLAPHRGSRRQGGGQKNKGTRLAIITMPCPALARRTLMANRSPVARLRARYTRPKAPREMGFKISKSSMDMLPMAEVRGVEAPAWSGRSSTAVRGQHSHSMAQETRRQAGASLLQKLGGAKQQVLACLLGPAQDGGIRATQYPPRSTHT